MSDFSSDVATYAALADVVYHRDERDQNLSSSSFSILRSDQYDEVTRDALAALGLTLSPTDGFIYGASTGFVATIATLTSGGFALVFRGTDTVADSVLDLSDSTGDAKDYQTDFQAGLGDDIDGQCDASVRAGW